jgi:MFS family permease
MQRLTLCSPRLAVGAMFLITGFAAAIWAASVPFLKHRLNLSDTHLGLTILAVGGGAVIAMPLASRLAAHIGSSKVLRIAGLLMPAMLLPIAIIDSVAQLVPLLFGFGIASGMVEVAGNAQGIALEKHADRPLMSWVHGMFSVGGLVGASAIALMLWTGLPIGGCIAVITLSMAAIAVAAGPGLLAHAHAQTTEKRARPWPPARLLLLALLCFIAFLAEGAIADWGGVFLHFDRGADPAIAALGYAGLAVAMTTGRLSGDRLRALIGGPILLRAGGALAACGFLLAVTTHAIWLTIAGFTLVGLGVANMVPVLMSTAGRLPNWPASAAVALVGAGGWAGFMTGPALLGALADVTSLAMALGTIALLMALVAASAQVVQIKG